MKNINNYISEKLIINKDTKIDKNVSYEDFLKALEKTGEIDLKLIFKRYEMPLDNKDREILSIWVVDHTLNYSYYNKGVGYDCEAILIFNWLDEEEKRRIYQYLTK